MEEEGALHRDITTRLAERLAPGLEDVGTQATRMCLSRPLD